VNVQGPCDIGDDEIDEIISDGNQSAGHILRKSRTLYAITFKGMSSANSGYLAEDTWRALGELCGGVLDDPQSGRYFVVQRVA
jgi:hypothetical protein